MLVTARVDDWVKAEAEATLRRSNWVIQFNGAPSMPEIWPIIEAAVPRRPALQRVRKAKSRAHNAYWSVFSRDRGGDDAL